MSWDALKVNLYSICNPKQWRTVPKSQLLDHGYPVYGANGQIGYYSEYNHEKPTILITCRGATCGTLNINKPFSYVTGNAMALDDLDERRTTTKFLYYALMHRRLDDVISGSAQPQITRTNLQKVYVPIPAIAEQNRIVAKVEKLLARVNAARERLAKAKEILKHFRQAVLAVACSGMLTSDWREKNPSADTADRLLGEIRLKKKEFVKEENIRKSNIHLTIENEPYDVPATWKWACLRDFTKYVTSGSRGWSKYYSEEGAYFVRSGEIKTNELKLEDAICVKLPERVEGKRALIEKGDILTTITGANVGKCALIKQEIPEAYVSQSVAVTKILDPKLSEYLYLSLLSPIAGGKDLNEMAYGVGRPVLSLPQINKIRIPLPPLKEQHEIVRRVEVLFNLADGIEKRVAVAVNRAERFTQAILAKAFRGELVPTEAELARHDGRSYEPASALLTKIKVQRKDA